MRGSVRQAAAFGLALAVLILGTLAFGADAPLPSYGGGAALCAAALLAGPAPKPPAFWLGLTTIAVLAALSMVRGNPWLAGPELAAMAGLAGAFSVGAAAGSSPRGAKRAGAMLTVSLAALALAAFIAHVAMPDAVLGRPKPYHEGRLTGAFLSANTAATLSGFGVVLGVSGVARAGRGAGSILALLDAVGRRGLGAAVLLVFSSACLLLTASRGGIAATGIVAGLMMLGQAAPRPVRWPVAAGLGVVLVLLVASSGGGFSDRLAEAGAGDNGRLILWRASLAAFAEAPLTGHGLGSFARALAPQITAATAPVLSAQGAAHNVALQWMVQTGIVGTAFGVATIAALFRTLASGLARRRGRWLVRAALGGLSLFCLHGLVDYAFEVPAAAWWLALLCGLGTGVALGEAPPSEDRRGRRGF